MHKKGHARGTDLLRSIKKTTFDFQELLESLLTQETSFFRYPSVFEAFEKRILPELHIRKFWKTPRSLRIWSAGCSTGEEPYPLPSLFPMRFRFLTRGTSRFLLPTSGFRRWPLPNAESILAAALPASAKNSSPLTFSRPRAANKFAHASAKWSISFR